ncbi:MAG: hypothetical protein OEZ68_01575 [Gammaproteobacteria bacterium]|nr:hypothetical protein [Gammaproteobacteria bacterium]MDH5799469.1 hypothetical protein [Gammaproteobacteria bacterium]
MAAKQADIIESRVFKDDGLSFFIQVKDEVLATYEDLQTLRQCSDLVKTKPERKVIIIGPTLQKHRGFMERTLHHLGVSCGQIVNSNRVLPGPSKGIWLLVRE